MWPELMWAFFSSCACVALLLLSFFALNGILLVTCCLEPRTTHNLPQCNVQSTKYDFHVWELNEKVQGVRVTHLLVLERLELECCTCECALMRHFVWQRQRTESLMRATHAKWQICPLISAWGSCELTCYIDLHHVCTYKGSLRVSSLV